MHHIARQLVSLPEGVLPKQIGDFSYAGTHETNALVKNYYFALYENGKGERALLKSWVKKYCTSYAHGLILHELQVHKAITRVSAQKTQAQQSTPICVPNLLAEFISEDLVWTLSEYILVDPSSAHFSVSLYSQIQAFMRELGNTKDVTRATGKRGVMQHIAGVLLAACVGLFRNPAQYRIIFLGLGYFIASLPELLSWRKYQLCHLDIKPDNILFSRGAAWLIDFQFTAVAHPVYDLAFSLHRALVVKQTTPTFTAALFELVDRLSQAEKRLLISLFLYGILFDLAFDHEVEVEQLINSFKQFRSHV